MPREMRIPQYQEQLLRGLCHLATMLRDRLEVSTVYLGLDTFYFNHAIYLGRAILGARVFDLHVFDFREPCIMMKNTCALGPML